MSNTNIQEDNFSLTVDNKLLLQDTKLLITKGTKYGIIGKNGSGKTTLLNYIYSKYHKSHDIFILEQEFTANDTIYNIVLNSNKKKLKLTKKINSLEQELSILEQEPSVPENILNEKLENYNTLQEEYNILNLDKDEGTIKKILTGLGFFDFEKNINQFSGGWRMRVSLARALYMRPKILLLDEPTNHLDLDAVVWLTEYLKNYYSKTVIVVSHNKNFLNNVCNSTILLENKKIHYFKGNFDKYIDLKIKFDKENFTKWTKYQKQLQQLKKVQKNLEERNKQVKIIEDKMKECEKIQTKKPSFNFSEIPKKNDLFVSLNNVQFSYQDKVVFQDLNFDIYSNNKIIIVGKNGIGKSTLLNLILGNIVPNSGQIHKNAKIRVGYYSQHMELLDYDLSPVEYLQTKETLTIENLNQDVISSKYNTTNDNKIKNEFLYRKYLGNIGLESKAHLQKISSLSGGQKSRVMFASLFVEKPHLILLDEPTNHLDLETVDALIECINNFNGSVVIITHNIDLIEKIDCKIYEIKDYGVNLTTFDNYTDNLFST